MCVNIFLLSLFVRKRKLSAELQGLDQKLKKNDNPLVERSVAFKAASGFDPLDIALMKDSSVPDIADSATAGNAGSSF